MHFFTFIFTVLTLLIPREMLDTRVGTAASDSPTASIFGAEGEVYGNCIPCVTEPNGMTFWTPQTTTIEKKGVSPYYYRDNEFLGFRSSHWLVGGATQEYGSFAILPGSKPVALDHAREKAYPHYYSLEGESGLMELSARSHSAIIRFNSDRFTLTVNSDRGEGWIEVDTTSCEIRACNPVHRIYQGKGQSAGFSGYIVLRFRDRVKSYTVNGQSAEIVFCTAGEKVVKAGCSFTSARAAAANLSVEIPSWSLDQVKEQLWSVWEKKLSAIEVQALGKEDSAALARMQHFYTSLWRASLLPRTVSDCGAPVDYDDFSMWDTFRALHPLLTILEPEKTGDMIQALLKKYDKGGWLPVFPCWGSYTSAMIGDHCISMITDAYVKGVRNFDTKKAYEAMRKNAFEVPGGRYFLDDTLYRDGRGRRALPIYLEYDYLPLEELVPYAYHSQEQVSRTLEYAYDDWCLSVYALKKGHLLDALRLRRRAGFWKNVFDPSTLYPQGRYADGSFLREKNYLQKTYFITEGTPCHYQWFVPHDVDGLMDMMGRTEYVSRLDSMFTEHRYWHGNEPCHQVAYMYDYAGMHSRTVATVRDILKSEYRNTPGGLSGNDDAGQMSAWYVFSSLGFYPVCPGKAEYALAAPAFENISLHLPGGNTLTIVNRDLSATHYSVRYNGKVLEQPLISHKQITSGGLLEFIPTK